MINENLNNHNRSSYLKSYTFKPPHKSFKLVGIYGKHGWLIDQICFLRNSKKKHIFFCFHRNPLRSIFLSSVCMSLILLHTGLK